MCEEYPNHVSMNTKAPAKEAFRGSGFWGIRAFLRNK